MCLLAFATHHELHILRPLPLVQRLHLAGCLAPLLHLLCIRNSFRLRRNTGIKSLLIYILFLPHKQGPRDVRQLLPLLAVDGVTTCVKCLASQYNTAESVIMHSSYR